MFYKMICSNKLDLFWTTSLFLYNVNECALRWSWQNTHNINSGFTCLDFLCGATQIELFLFVFGHLKIAKTRIANVYFCKCTYGKLNQCNVTEHILKSYFGHFILYDNFYVLLIRTWNQKVFYLWICSVCFPLTYVSVTLYVNAVLTICCDTERHYFN